MLPLWNLILGWLLTVLIIVGNGLVIYLITTTRNLRTTANSFVLSLAVADFCVGVFYYPRFSLCRMYPHICRNNMALEHVAFCVIVFFLFTSVTSLCALTLDRYIAVVKPLRYVSFMTKRRAVLLIRAAWTAAVPVLISCLASKFAESTKTRRLIAERLWISLGVLNVLACAFLLISTAKVFLIARRIARRNATLDAQLSFNYGRQLRGARKTREAASAKMIGTLVAFFVICYLIDTFLTLTLRAPLSFPNRKATVDVLFVVVRFLKLTNSAVNPLAYAFYKREIWRELKRKRQPSTVQSQRQAPSYPLLSRSDM